MTQPPNPAATRASLLIEASELKSALQQRQPHWVIFDCRFRLNDSQWGRNAYNHDHIPGAYYLDLNRDLAGTVARHGGRHPLPEWQQLIETLCHAGLGPYSNIVLYDDSQFAFAARAWWLLKQLGLNARLLDGGYNAWLAVQGEKDRRTPNSKPSSIRPQLQANITSKLATPHRHWLSREQIQSGNYLLIDSREAKRYAGIEEPIDPVAGHIPGALNFPWQAVCDKQGFCLSSEQQAQRWQTLPNDKPLAVYCGSGVTACVNLFSLALIERDALLYPGSWSDWCSYD